MTKVLIGYATLGLSYAIGVNLYGLVSDRPTVFAADAPPEMWFWAFGLPAVAWPFYVAISAYHWLLR